MASFKIGQDITTLQEMPHPNGRADFITDYQQPVRIDNLANGKINVTYTGIESEQMTLNFTNKTPSDLAKIRAFANIALPYWVQIINDASQLAWNGWAIIRLQTVRTSFYSDEPRYSFDLILNQYTY